MISPAALSVCALVTVVVVSCTSRVNVGLLAIPLAWVVGVHAGRGADGVLTGFPVSLFVTLAGVTLLFSLSETNGTVELLARRLLAVARGRSRAVPILIFCIAGIVASVGPGAIVSVALIAPVAMAIGQRGGLPPFLTALMVANGANAGNLSPVSAVGIIANDRMMAAGIGGHEWKVFAANFLAHAAVGAVAYGLLIRQSRPSPADVEAHPGRLTVAQWLTVAAVAGWILAVTGFDAPIGLSAFAAAALVVVLRAADETRSIKAMPWAAIVMVSGMTMLVTLVERTGGLQMFTGLLARLASPSTLNGVIALVTGVISTYSSTSAVVLPTFLPTVPGLVQQVGGGDPLAVALSINVGASLVDVSPLSTLGALCVAALPDAAAAKDLFRKLMIWGLSMSVAGAILCQLLASPFARL